MLNRLCEWTCDWYGTASSFIWRLIKSRCGSAVTDKSRTLVNVKLGRTKCFKSQRWTSVTQWMSCSLWYQPTNSAELRGFKGQSVRFLLAKKFSSKKKIRSSRSVQSVGTLDFKHIRSGKAVLWCMDFIGHTYIILTVFSLFSGI